MPLSTRNVDRSARNFADSRDVIFDRATSSRQARLPERTACRSDDLDRIRSGQTPIAMRQPTGSGWNM